MLRLHSGSQGGAAAGTRPHIDIQVDRRMPVSESAVALPLYPRSSQGAHPIRVGCGPGNALAVTNTVTACPSLPTVSLSESCPVARAGVTRAAPIGRGPGNARAVQVRS